jgi:hypothetical protein
MSKVEDRLKADCKRLLKTIKEDEWLYSKNENRLVRTLNVPVARMQLRVIHNMLEGFPNE